MTAKYAVLCDNAIQCASEAVVCVCECDIKTTINKLGTCRCKAKFCQPGFEALN